MCPPVSEAHPPDLRAQCVREGSLSLTHTGARSGPKSCHCRSEYRRSSKRYCGRVVREIKTNLRRANGERRMEALRARRTAGQEGAARMKETARGLQGFGEQRRAPGSRPLSASHRHVRPASPGGSAPAPGLRPSATSLSEPVTRRSATGARGAGAIGPPFSFGCFVSLPRLWLSN